MSGQQRMPGQDSKDINKLVCGTKMYTQLMIKP